MDIQTTRVYEENAQAWLDSKRRALNEGGTYSSKTYSILQILILIAQHAKARLLISVVSESLPHLKRGCIRDFFNILGESPNNNPRYNKTEQTYTFGFGTIEFFGADDKDKVRGPRRDILFINEANNVPWDAARGLDIRTNKFTFCDWNPVGEFWVHQYEDSGGQAIPGWLSEQSSAYIHSTYLDALDVIPQEVVANIESNRDKDPNWWNIYGLGLLGRIEGLVYPFFTQVDRLPDGKIFYGLDFGFSVDPTVVVANVIIGDKLFSSEVIYKTGLTNDAIARQMDLLKVGKNSTEIYADASEPKSIEEIRLKGFSIYPAEKGPGSVEYGIQKVNQFTQHWTKDSLNCIKEQRNFRYIQDKNGKLTEKTLHLYSHGMDARRYAVSSQMGSESHTTEVHAIGHGPKTLLKRRR